MRFLFLFGMVFFTISGCSTESARPITDVRIPLRTSIDELEKRLIQFGNDQKLHFLQNDRNDMMVLNGGNPALSFWFATTKKAKTGFNVLTVNENGNLRVMFYEDGFQSHSQRENMEELFFSHFDKGNLRKTV